jgi:hypothetical protein
VADETRSASLRDAIKNGIFRLDPVHRMSGIIESSVLKAHIKGTNNKAISVAELRKLNDAAEFPILTLPSSLKVEMQSGRSNGDFHPIAT